MNYTYILAGNGGKIPDLTIGIVFRDPWQRPIVGGRVFIKGVEYTVVTADPPSNPDNVTVKYRVEPFNADHPYRRGTDTRIP